jgi:ubiquinone/menaquinone biosynthesis C-methylase UbiE
MTSSLFNAAAYAAFRPQYPAGLYPWIASNSPNHQLAWDCGCGSGQATGGLIEYFDRVIATDISGEQLSHAPDLPRVTWQQSPAESSGLPDQSVDALMIAQALHWFDLPRFWPEVQRVMQRGGLVTAWCYQDLVVDEPACNTLVRHFQSDIVGNYWPPQRRHVDNGYAEISFPFRRVESPKGISSITAQWDVDQLLGYFRSWSATRIAAMESGHDPIAPWAEQFRRLWGPTRRNVTWPLVILGGRVD